IEWLWMPTIDNSSGDVRSEPGKTQEGVDVGCRHSLLASDVMHGQFGVLNEASLDIVSASDNPQQARIDCRLVIGTSILISRPTRLRHAGPCNVTASSGSRPSLSVSIVRYVDCPASNAARWFREIVISIRSGFISTRHSSAM